jgi:hypothetical protein
MHTHILPLYICTTATHILLTSVPNTTTALKSTTLSVLILLLPLYYIEEVDLEVVVREPEDYRMPSPHPLPYVHTPALNAYKSAYNSIRQHPLAYVHSPALNADTYIVVR